jgi:hypothetical protein
VLSFEIGSFQRLSQRASGIHSMRVDGKACVFAWESSFCLRQTQFVADKIEAIRRIGAIKNGEGRIESDAVGVFTEQSVCTVFR